MNRPSLPKSRAFLAFSALLAILSAPTLAAADNPYDALQRERATEVSRAGRAARGVLPLLELWRDWEWATPGVTAAELERLAANRRLPATRRAYAQSLLARARLRSGDVDGSRQLVNELGYVTSWRVIGSFDNEGKQGFGREMPPEIARLEPWDDSARYPGKERTVTWRDYPAVGQLGYVDFDAVFRPNTSSCGYAETFIESERAQPLGLWMGNGGAVKVWWNGEEVLADDVYRQPDPDRHVAVVGAHEGWNRLLVKLCVSESTWGFFLRVADPQGGPAQGVRADGTAHREVQSGHARVRLPRAPRTVLATLEAAAQGRESAQALEDLARFLAYTGADDPAERRARQLATRAADLDPDVDRLKLAAVLADERGEVQRFAQRAIEVAPTDPEALLLHARVLATGPDPIAALAVLDRIPARGVASLRGALLRAGIHRDLELADSSMRLVDEVAENAPGAPGWLEQRAVAADAAGRADRAIELRKEALRARWDDGSSRRALIADALRRGDPDAVREHLDVLDQLHPGSTQHALFASQVWEGLGENDRALEALTRARAVAPEDATLVAAHGRMLLRLGRRDAAADTLREALVLRPQDADTRELLEQIRPEEERQDEAYALDSRELLALRRERSGYPITLLQDLTVNTVYENGLGSSFHQTGVQIHDDEGARQWRTHSIQYDPDSQRVDIRRARVYRADGRVLDATETFEQQLGEPWYRIYYDTRALVVVFPTLEAGDTVEIQYRVDDVAHRNLFADYYGDMHFLQGFTPIARKEYVLIAPRSRQLYFNEPGLEGLRHEQSNRGDRQIHRFFAEDVPAIRTEQGMPGMTEIAPYLHVSTYRTWEEVGRWWWGLVQDQLQTDENLRQVVRELVADAPDVRTKVQRIHNWVVRNTRYVGLEFGIHGYKPYRVPLVVQRGFGDCKDKASLLYTMFREAGIDARIALVRTRRNGSIEDLPASLAVFDHAIAYVPELDLYLDGTAEHSGTTELPSMDQGVTVLVVGPEDARLTRTPVLSPDQNRRERSMDVRLAVDGSAEVEVEERIVGGESSRYRSTYQSAGTREDRFERALRSQFPGLVLESQTMRHLDDLESPVELEYEARVPQMARRDGDRLRVQATVLEDLLRSLAARPQRRHPLEIGSTSSYAEERVIHLPAGHQVAVRPDGGEAESEFGLLRLRVDGEGRRLRARTELEIRRDRVTPDEYPAFRAWVEEADRLLRQQIVIAPGGER